MKALVCEMCNSHDVVKQDGMFVCQSCGTKYSVEEAKKMMIEGTVDVSGSTVKVDNSAFVQKYLQNARRAKKKEDWEETEKYYNLVEQNDPTNIEAIFYSAYGKAQASLVDSDFYKRQAVFKVLNNSISVIDDNFDITEEDEQKKIIMQISADIMQMRNSDYVYNRAQNGYGSTWDDREKTVTLFNTLEIAFAESLVNIAKKYPDTQLQESDSRHKLAFYYRFALRHCQNVLDNGHLTDRTQVQAIMRNYHRELNQIDPNHEIPTPNIPAPTPAPAAAPMILGILGAGAAYISINMGEMALLLIIAHICCIIGIILGIKEYRREGASLGMILSIIGEVMAIIFSVMTVWG